MDWRLETDWWGSAVTQLWIGDGLVPHWYSIGEGSSELAGTGLAIDWHQIGNELTPRRWGSAARRIWIGTGLAWDCSDPCRCVPMRCQ